jgi:hypothetical protein
MMVVPTSVHRNVADEVVHAIKWAITRHYMSLETVRELCNDAVLDAVQIASI